MTPQLRLRFLTGIILALIFFPFLVAGGGWFVGFSVALSLILFAEWIGMVMRSPHRSLIWILVGAIYTLPLIWFLPFLRFSDNGLIYVFFLFGVVIATDTGAYFGGRYFGGAKLAPRISPQKTRSGAVSGLFCAGVIGLVFAYELGALTILGALFLSITSQLGDLFESYTKRRLGTKDSGNWLPGHGGLLDRFDGFLAALIPSFLYVWLA